LNRVQEAFRKVGFVIVRGSGPDDVPDPLLVLSTRHGERGLLGDPAVAAWMADPRIRRVLSDIGAAGAEPVSAIWFDKQPAANWRVPWHQDLFACLPRFTAPGWGPWTTKGGLPHVAWPDPWNRDRIAIRLHLDPCGADNGPLVVLPGSHRSGVLDQAAIDAAAAAIDPVAIHANPGDLLIMDPLLLHRSAPARSPGHRRVLHGEWCTRPPPGSGPWSRLIARMGDPTDG
jgi:hypothetical protein